MADLLKKQVKSSKLYKYESPPLNTISRLPGLFLLITQKILS